jgi:DHA2 family multidrug resistance protein-like MFS transporter
MASIRQWAGRAARGNTDVTTTLARNPASMTTPPEADGLPTPRRYWSAIAIWLALAMAVLDSSIANVALPTIAHDLGASPAASIWVVNAYQIAITMLLLPIASLAEIAGYRRMYSGGLALFVLASLACTFATGLGTLAAARFVQGFGAAAVMAINGALVRFTYPRAMLGRGIGYNALVVAISSAAGPSMAAAILALGSWRWLFAVNVPLGLLSLAIGYRALPRVAGVAKRFDLPSALLNALAFAALFLAAEDLAHGRPGPRLPAECAVALAAGWALVRRARPQAAPLIPLDLLRVPVLRLSYATSACSFAAQMAALVALPFYLQSRFGFDHVDTGLLITPWPLGVAMAAPLAGRLVERVPAGLLGGIGLGLMMLALGLLAAIPAQAAVPALVGAMALCGIGFGLFQTPNNRTMLGLAPHGRSGAAAGMLATARLVGQTAGAVLVGLLFRLQGTASSAPLLLGAALALVAALTSLMRLRSG